RPLPWNRDSAARLSSRYPFFETALGTLSTGLALEENDRVLGGLRAGLRQLIPVGARLVLETLYELNREVQLRLVEAIADHCAFLALDSPDENEGFWLLVESVTGYRRQDLSRLVDAGVLGLTCRNRNQVAERD